LLGVGVRLGLGVGVEEGTGEGVKVGVKVGVGLNKGVMVGKAVGLGVELAVALGGSDFSPEGTAVSAFLPSSVAGKVAVVGASLGESDKGQAQIASPIRAITPPTNRPLKRSSSNNRCLVTSQKRPHPT
jgi:hypothetical protein